MTDDVVLLRRYATEGCEAAFSELVERYLPLVCSNRQQSGPWVPWGGSVGSHLFMLHLAESFCCDRVEAPVPASSLFEPEDRGVRNIGVELIH